MTGAEIRRWDNAALYAALEARRADLGLSWQGVAADMTQLSAELIKARGLHPVSPSTLRNVATNPKVGCQHALEMLRWLERTPESFLVGMADGDDPRFALPAAGPDRSLRFGLKLLWATMDEERRNEGLTWAGLAGLLGCGPSQLTGLRTARYATTMDLAMRIAQWTGRPAADFVYSAEW